MSRPFDMELFLAGVLTGPHAKRERHLRQAKVVQAAITERWHRNNPWTWQRKHLAWFLCRYLNEHAVSTRYYYRLTVQLVAIRLNKPWQFNTQNEIHHTSKTLGGNDKKGNDLQGKGQKHFYPAVYRNAGDSVEKNR